MQNDKSPEQIVLPKFDPETIQANSYLLVMGDVTGIQQFLYAIAQFKDDEERAKGTAKRLRGRSLYMQEMTKIYANFLLAPWLDQPDAGIIFCSGGAFQFIVPNQETQDPDQPDQTLSAPELLTRRRQAINEDLFKKFYGQFGMVVDWIEAPQADLTHQWKSKIAELYDAIANAKQHKFADQENEIYSSGSIEHERKTLTEEPAVFAPCPSCKQRLKVKSKPTCEICKEHHDYGNRFAAWVKNLANAPLVKIEGFGQSSPQQKTTVPIITEGGSEILKPLLSKEEDQQHLKDNDTVPFELLAALSFGDKRIGVLKMDVDNLGVLLSEGIKEPSIKTTMTLSQKLDAFFTTKLNQICENRYKEWKKSMTEAGRTAQAEAVSTIFYTVYAGGDDTLIIGPWSEIPHLAVAIRQRFKDYAAEHLTFDRWKNPVTISAGIFFCKPRFPIARFAELAEHELKQSKQARPKTEKDLGKDRITVFGQTVTWADFSRQLSEADQGHDFLEFGEMLFKAVKREKKPLPRGFIHKLLRLKKQYVPNHEDADWHVIPALIYLMKRTIEDENLMNQIKKELITTDHCLEKMNHIPISAGYALLKSRKESGVHER